MRTLECIEPIPKPSAHPFGGDALNATTLGLPRMNKTNDDSEIDINIANEIKV